MFAIIDCKLSLKCSFSVSISEVTKLRNIHLKHQLLNNNCLWQYDRKFPKYTTNYIAFLLSPSSTKSLPTRITLSKLSPNNPQREHRRMAIRKVHSWIRLNLRNPKSSTRINPISHNPRCKRTCQTASRDTASVVSDSIREGETWGAGSTARSLVNVCCGARGGGVGAGDVEEGYVLILLSASWYAARRKEGDGDAGKRWRGVVRNK